MAPRGNRGEGAGLGSSSRARLWLAGALVAVAAAHAGALRAAPVWDDHYLLGPEGAVARAGHWQDLFALRFWSLSDQRGLGVEYYRPLTLLSFRIERALGHGASALHASNVALHLLVCALLFACAVRAGARPEAAALAAALFGTWPRLTEAVTFLSGRTDVLATLGVLGALALHTSAPGAHARRIAAALCLLAGMLGKEVAAAGAVALAAQEWAARSAGSAGARALARNLAPAAVALLALAGLRAAAAVPLSSHATAPLPERGLFALQALGTYAWMLATPWRPQLVIGRIGWHEPVYIALGVVAALALAAAAAGLLARRIPARHAAWLALAIAALLPVLHLVPISLRVIAADRFLYLPLAGAAIGLALALPPLQGRGRALLAAGAFAVAGLGVATAARIHAYTDERVLWEGEAARAHPGNGQAHLELANQLARRGAMDRAVALYQESLRRERVLRERFPTAPIPETLLSNYGLVLADRGRAEEAIGILSLLVRARPDVALYQLHYGSVLARALRFEAADRALARALELHPGYGPAAQMRAQNARARSLWEAMPPEGHGEATSIRAQRAQVYQWVGRLERAAALWLEVARAPDADVRSLAAVRRALDQQRRALGETPATRALSSALAERDS